MTQGTQLNSGTGKYRVSILAESAKNAKNTVHCIRPLDDSRWNEFVERHPHSSIFHSVEWLRALRLTYGYEPIVITTSPSGIALRNGLVLCRVNSWLTGRRLVSLPFSDHCEPLLDEREDFDAFTSTMETQLDLEKLLYIEIRPTRPLAFTGSLSCSTCEHYFHKIDLAPDLETLFSNCHKNSTQRKIRRAEREGLVYEDGRSKRLLDIFYRLLVLTRRRHHLPPQPIKWFENLIDCLGESAKIRVALKDRQPVASILTLQYKDTLLYKYGCSDVRFNQLGGTHLLLWRSIEEAKARKLRVMDLGRSECENTGLVTFKDRWGGNRSVLTYFRFAAPATSRGHFVPADADWKQRAVRRVVPVLPDRILCALGNVIYKHLG